MIGVTGLLWMTLSSLILLESLDAFQMTPTRFACHLNPTISSSISRITISSSAITTHTCIMKNTKTIRSTTTTKLRNYLDSLSQANHSDDNNEHRHQNKSSFSSSYTPPVTGIIPSGRGPLGSYLDGMTRKHSDHSSSDMSDISISSDTASITTHTSSRRNQSQEHISPRTTTRASSLTAILTSPQDDARTDIRNLLTQRAIQSFLRLSEECRDPHSAKWIQDFLHLSNSNLMDYHGTASAFMEDYQGIWDAPLIDMIRQPQDTIVVSSKRRGRGHGGWSPHNPYLQERWVEMAISIDPVNLANRILSVREQIAKEWCMDLDVLMQANDEILDSFFHRVKSDIPSVSGGMNPTPTEAFDKTAFFKMDSISRASHTLSSPLRRANFDLMYNLCTQAAIHRILRAHKKECEHRNKYNNKKSGGIQDSSLFTSKDWNILFLKQFYMDRVEEYFDGNLEYGQADSFMDELLQTSPRIMSFSNLFGVVSGGTTSTTSGSSSSSSSTTTISGLIDPVGAAELIIEMRNVVAKDWKIWMNQVSEDHTTIRQHLYARQILLQNVKEEAEQQQQQFRQEWNKYDDQRPRDDIFQ